MTIKKTVKVKPTGSPATAATAAGGATIANRFKLDTTAPEAKRPAASGTAVKVAGIAGLVALVVVGILTFVLYKHWEFLMPA